MIRYLAVISILAVSSFSLWAQQPLSADSSQGAQLLDDLRCTTCHRSAGRGAGAAPDLTRTVARGYSPSAVTAQIWSHAPAIWSCLKEQGIACPRLTREQGAALFAYFAAARYFEALGDARRGKAVFQSLMCSDCHTLAGDMPGKGKPIPSWHSLADPMQLACAFLNRPSEMNGAAAAGKRNPVRMTYRDVNDLLVYLRSRPQTRGATVRYSMPADAGDGRRLFEERGCGRCHTGELSPDRRDARVPFYSGFVAAMWNHNQRLAAAGTKPTRQELETIAGYLWYAGLFDERGSAARGQRLYARLGCSSCHDQGRGAPELARTLGQGEAVPFCICVAVGVWNHGPAMLEQMRSKQMAWPELTCQEVADLSAYLRGGTAASQP